MSKKQAIRDMTLAISKLPESATLSDLSRLLFSLADALEAPHLARIAELESLVARLADMMLRSDMNEFTSDVKPVTSAEWFGALHEAEALLSERPAFDDGNRIDASVVDVEEA